MKLDKFSVFFFFCLFISERLDRGCLLLCNCAKITVIISNQPKEMNFD